MFVGGGVFGGVGGVGGGVISCRVVGVVISFYFCLFFSCNLFRFPC